MKKQFGSDKSRRFAPSPSGDRKFQGGKPGFKPKKRFGDDSRGSGEFPEDRRPQGDRPTWKSDRPAWKSDRPSGGDDRPRRFGDKPSYGEKRPYGDKPAWKSDKPSYKSDRPAWKSDRPSGGDDRPRSFGDKPSYGSKPSYGEKRPYGDKPAWKSDKPGYKSDRPAWKSDRPSSGDDRPRSFGDKPSYGSKPSYGEKRPYGDKPAWKSDRPSFKSDRPAWKSDRPSGSDDRPRSFGDKPSYGSKPSYGEKRPYGDKPAWKSDKPAYKSDRPAWKSDRPSGGDDRPRRFDDKPSYGEKRPYGDKPAWKSDRPSYKTDKPSRKPERPVWTPDESFPRKAAARDSVTVPYNKKNRDEAAPSAPEFVTSAPAEKRDFVEKFSRPNYRSDIDAKTLIVTLEDTHNVPVRLVWIYDSMVGSLPDGEPAAGDTVYVYDQNNRFIGSAIYNPHSRIRARIFSIVRQKFDQDYLRDHMNKAVQTRRALGLAEGSYRAVFGEGDGIPGLIADKIGEYLVIQPLTFAVNRYLQFIVDHLNSLLAPEGIVVRTDVPIRAKEGLEVTPPAIHGEVPERVEIREAGTIQFANPAGGQKTGLFLDQRLNREAMKPFCDGGRVLDLFCHVGGWAIRAASYGAAEVIGVDSSESALELAAAGAKANGFDNVSFVEDDVFEYLRSFDNEPENQFDVIVCDPPAFAKTRSHYEEAFRAYLSLNYLVMKKLKPGGVLITCSCSQAVSPLEFNEAILTAARNARMQFQVLERRGAPQDHPVLLGLPESEYLKCFVLKRTE